LPVPRGRCHAARAITVRAIAVPRPTRSPAGLAKRILVDSMSPSLLTRGRPSAVADGLPQHPRVRWRSLYWLRASQVKEWLPEDRAPEPPPFALLLSCRVSVNRYTKRSPLPQEVCEPG